MVLGNIKFTYSEANKAYELQHIGESGNVYVIAFFRKNSCGYYMETVGDRFFEDRYAFVVGKHAMNFLNDVFPYEED